MKKLTLKSDPKVFADSLNEGDVFAASSEASPAHLSFHLNKRGLKTVSFLPFEWPKNMYREYRKHFAIRRVVKKEEAA